MVELSRRGVGGGEGDEGREHDTVSGTGLLLEVKLSRKLLFFIWVLINPSRSFNY